MPLRVNVTDSPYNAAGDGTTDDRSAFQDAIDDVNADGGGGVVEVPPADVGYLIDTTGLAAKSNVELRLDKGARIMKGYGDTGIAKALIHNADTTFATKVTGFSVTGQGTLTADDGSAINDGIIIGLWGDDLVLSDFTIDTYQAGQAILIGGDRNRLRALRITGSANTSGTGGIRLFGGNDNVISSCHIESGDDALQFVPIAGSGGLQAIKNLSIARSTYIGCTGASTVGRFLIAGLIDTSARYVSDAQTTATFATLTSSSANFQAPDDVGARVVVAGAGPGGLDLVTTIASVTSSTVAVMADAADGTVSSADAGIGVLDASITGCSFVDCSGTASARRILVMNSDSVGSISGLLIDGATVDIQSASTPTGSGDVLINAGTFGTVQNVRLRGVRIRCITDASMAGRSFDVVNTATGTMRVSSVETTVLDLVAHPLLSGGLSNVATIVGEMLEEHRIDVGRLAGAADAYPSSVAQRCGWLLDYMTGLVGVDLDTSPLAEALDRPRLVPLQPGGRKQGERDRRWRVTVNSTPEPDL